MQAQLAVLGNRCLVTKQLLIMEDMYHSAEVNRTVRDISHLWLKSLRRGGGRYMVEELNKREGLLYVHFVEPRKPTSS